MRARLGRVEERRSMIYSVGVVLDEFKERACAMSSIGIVREFDFHVRALISRSILTRSGSISDPQIDSGESLGAAEEFIVF